MIEAMACGTPVVATRRGSVPEVVTHGVTGFVADRVDELPRLVELCSGLDAGEIREDVARRFSVDRMIQGYRRAYERVIGPGVAQAQRPVRIAG